MSFYNGILNLTNWAGNVIMPTLGGLFIAIAVIQFARGYNHLYSTWAYGGLMCLMVSGLLRMFEKRLRGYRAIGYARGEAPLGYAEPMDDLTIDPDDVLRVLDHESGPDRDDDEGLRGW